MAQIPDDPFYSESLCEVQPPNGYWPLEHSNLTDLSASDEKEEKQQLVVVVAVGVGGGGCG